MKNPITKTIHTLFLMMLQIIFCCSFLSTKAQNNTTPDPELDKFILTVGEQKAKDSCLVHLKVMAAILSKPGAVVKFTQDKKGWFPVTCARWSGFIHNEEALPYLDKIIAFARSSELRTPHGDFITELQQNAYTSRARILIKSGQTTEAARKIISDYEAGLTGETKDLHTLDLIDYSMSALASVDGLYPSLLVWGFDRFRQIPVLPVETGEELKIYQQYMEFLRLAIANSYERRKVLVNWLGRPDKEGREFAISLADPSEETINILVARYLHPATESKPELKLKIIDILDGYGKQLKHYEQELKGSDSERQKAYYQNLADKMRSVIIKTKVAAGIE